MYSRSCASFSDHEVSRVMRSWAKPVMPGLDDQPLPVLRDLLAELLEEGGPDRARADDAHVAAQHVPELRQLVEVREAQDAAERASPRPAVRRVSSWPRYGPSRASASGRERAELEHREDPPRAPDAPAAVEHRAPGGEPDREPRRASRTGESTTAATPAIVRSSARSAMSTPRG